MIIRSSQDTICEEHEGHFVQFFLSFAQIDELVVERIDSGDSLCHIRTPNIPPVPETPRFSSQCAREYHWVSKGEALQFSG